MRIVASVLFGIGFIAGCGSNDGAECEWKVIRQSDSSQLAGANSVGEYTSESCNTHALIEAKKYCATAGFEGIMVDVQITWRAPVPLLGSRDSASRISTIECK